VSKSAVIFFDVRDQAWSLKGDFCEHIRLEVQMLHNIFLPAPEADILYV